MKQWSPQEAKMNKLQQELNQATRNNCIQSEYFTPEKTTGYQLYVALITDTRTNDQFVKVGISLDPARRFKSKRSQKGLNGCHIMLMSTVDLKTKNKKKAEAYEVVIHRMLTQNLLKYNPVVKFDGFTECFTIEALGFETEIHNRIQQLVGEAVVQNFETQSFAKQFAYA